MGLSAALLLINGSVNAAAYHFFQGGFPDSGFVRGSFSGEDKFTKYSPEGGPDGLFYMCSGRSCSFSKHNEILEFSIHFGGNSLFESLNNLPDGRLIGLVYSISQNKLEDVVYGSCDTTCFPRWIYGGGSKLIDISAVNGTFLNTSQSLQVSQVPLPGALGLFVAGGLALAGVLRKKAD